MEPEINEVFGHFGKFLAHSNGHSGKSVHLEWKLCTYSVIIFFQTLCKVVEVNVRNGFSKIENRSKSHYRSSWTLNSSQLLLPVPSTTTIMTHVLA